MSQRPQRWPRPSGCHVASQQPVCSVRRGSTWELGRKCHFLQTNLFNWQQLPPQMQMGVQEYGLCLFQGAEQLQDSEDHHGCCKHRLKSHCVVWLYSSWNLNYWCEFGTRKIIVSRYNLDQHSVTSLLRHHRFHALESWFCSEPGL